MGLFSTAVLAPLLVASTLGMGVGTEDNDGVGSPLTVQEVEALSAREARTRPGGEQPMTYEEAAEEQALVDILQGGIRRAK